MEASTGERPAQAEFRLLAGDGSHRYVDVVATRVIEHDEPGFVLTCHDVTERRALEQQLSHQAFHDSLTGLANRSLFRDRLEHAITRSTRSATRFAVLFIDLDDFKDVNDSLGHAAGDSMLRQMTYRLGEAVREEDTVARLGGDEFAILLESVDSDDEVIAVASRIVRSAREPFEVGESTISSGLSIGVAIADTFPTSAEAVMRNADLALYEAKNLGKNRHALFAPAMHEQAVDTPPAVSRPERRHRARPAGAALPADRRPRDRRGGRRRGTREVAASRARPARPRSVRRVRRGERFDRAAGAVGSPHGVGSGYAMAEGDLGVQRAHLDRQLERTPGAGGHPGRRRAVSTRRLRGTSVHTGSRDHRIDAATRRRRHDGTPPRAGRPRRSAVHRRLRYRLLVAQLPSATPRRRAQVGARVRLHPRLPQRR